jgi:hypothetical protein
LPGNPLTQETRTIPELDAPTLATRQEIHHIAIYQHYFGQIKDHLGVLASDHFLDRADVFRFNAPTHAQYNRFPSAARSLDFAGHSPRSFYGSLRPPTGFGPERPVSGISLLGRGWNQRALDEREQPFETGR